MNKFITVVIASLILVGCAGTDVNVHTLNSNAPALEPSLPTQIQTLPVHWTVLTNTQIQELAKQNNADVVYYALDAQNFQNLSLTMSEVQRFLGEEKNVVIAYRNYYDGTIDKAPKKKTPSAKK
jgi:hypothetical protein